MKKIALLFSLCLLLLPIRSFAAGMSAEMKFISTHKGKTTHAHGHYYFDFDRLRMRMDMQSDQMNTTMIMDPSTHTSIVLVHDKKMFLKTDPKKTQADYPWLRASVDQNSLKKVMEKEGWKVTPSANEQFEGHSCLVWNLTSTKKQGVTIKTWLAKDLNYHPLKSIHHTPNAQIEMSFSNIKTENLKDDLFFVPKGYQEMSGAPSNQTIDHPQAKGNLPDGTSATNLQDQLMAIANNPKLTPQEKRAAMNKLVGR